MPEIAEIWKEVLPSVLNAVTGRGVWAALNACKPVAIEENQFVIGIDPRDTELAGHLRIPSTKTLIEQSLAKTMGKPMTLRVIDGTTSADWETVKRRDAEGRRMQEAAMAKAKAAVDSRNNWDTVYEQLSRIYAATPNKSLPQNRAKFYNEALNVLVEARKAQPNQDDLTERNFARCLERLSQYSEIPSAIVAMHVLQRAGE
jgi:hypothetical protein